MNREQLLRIIASGESQEIEFKESFHSSQKFSEIMCGFANTYGGVILLGVSSKKEIIGIHEKMDDIQQKLSSSAQAVSPALLPSIEVHELSGKTIVAVTVQRAIDNMFHTFQGVIWFRVGSTTKKAEGPQIMDFLRSRQILCFDEISSNAKITDLNLDKIQDYLNVRRQSGFFRSHTVEEFLISMKLATRNGDLKIKNSALLFFAKEPLFFNPQIEIKLVRFDGVEPVKIISHELVQSDLVEGIERALSFVKLHLSRTIQIKLDAKREERYEYPIDVVREAIVNAVAHRDYFSKDAIQLYIFSDRIEITNPGSLPQGLPKELFGTISVQRNPITYRILRDYGYVEGLGSGIPRMINSMRKHKLSDPEFSIYEHFFRIILRNRKGEHKPIQKHSDLNERQLKAIEFLKTSKSLKTKTYMQMNKVSLGTARSDISEMLQFGYIKKIGKFKGAYYVLN